MDVRCEKCHTEYELDDSKVTETGVTVKCTSCGNLFKIKRKSAQPPPRPPEPPADSGSMWLIRSPGGENRRFRELTTLQQWIVERKVSRDCEISRTGETWKKLGDIAELASFFAIVDQAQSGGRPPPTPPRRATQPPAPPTVVPARSQPVVAVLPIPPPVETSPAPLELEPDPEPEPAPPPMAMPLPAPAREPVVLMEGPTGGRVAPTASVRKPPRRDSWSGNAVAADSGEPAWTKGPPLDGAIKDARTVRVEPSAFGDEFSDLEILRRRRGGHGWMWIVALVLLAGAGGGWALLRTKSEPVVAPAAPDAGAAVGPVVTPGVVPDAAAKAVVAVDPKALEAYQQAVAKAAQDTDDAFAAADKLLDGARVADPAQDAKVLAAQAVIAAARAQYLDDDAAAAEPAQAAQLRAEAERQLTRADKLAKEAQAKAPGAPEIAVAVADVLRLQKRSAAEVDKALAPAGDAPDALYVKGMAAWRDGKAAEAAALLERAVAAAKRAGGDNLRARYRLAAIAAAAKKPDAAKTQLDAILAAQPAHARAKALATRLAQPTTAAVAPPPPVDTQKPPPAAKPAPGEESGPVTARDYEGLVKKGDKLAENGDCAGATRAFERALDARPNGVEALTGLGYCSLDHKEYDRAVANFRAALAISPRYSEALIGLAESYRFRGMNAEALTYYKRYLDQSPTGSKAGMAKRHVDELQPAAAPEPKPEAPPPTTPTPPPPAPPPIDKLPDKPGVTSEPPPPPAEKEKPPEKPAETPPPAAAPAEAGGEPRAPDSPQTK